MLLNNINIRKAKLTDLPVLQKLYVETIETSCSRDYSPEQIRVWVSSIYKKARWKEAISQQYFLTAEEAGEILGFASLDKGNRLDFMYVSKDRLREGIAAALYNELKNESKRLGKTGLSSDVSITARPFFEKQGFEVVHENIHHIEGVEIRNYKMKLEYG